MFSLRIVTTSHYQSLPIPGLDPTHSEFRDTAVKRVPVLRIFGSTPAGQKTCMHVHGVFPYLCVPYDGTQPTDRYLRQFAASLDKALNVASRSANANQQHVYKISLVSGIPMYGYHPREEQFLKIYLYNPLNVRKAADLLLGGAVMNKPFQPHESHIPYPLQLFIDYNLYGMNLINVAALKFRKRAKDNKNETDSKKVPADTPQSTSVQDASTHISLTSTSSISSLSSSPVDRIWHEENIPTEMWLPANIERQSTCELEVDVVAADITNRQELASNIGSNPGLAALWEDEKQRKRDAGESSQMEPESSQERLNVFPSASEKEFVQRFLDIVKHQQTFRDSQSDDSVPSQPSLPASQLERHISREDSMTSSQSTVILSGSAGDETGGVGDEDDEHPPIINIDSIKKVVSCSQSFSHMSPQKAVSDSQDRSVADILASLLDENGPPPSQLASLEDQDSILNDSTVRGVEDEKEDEEETLLMSQVLQNNKDDKDNSSGEGTSRMKCDLAGLDDTWNPDQDDDIVMNTDDDSESDEVDLLPQFDGASDKITDPHKKSDQGQAQGSSSSGQSSGLASGPGGMGQGPSCEVSTTSGPDMGWRAGVAGRGMGAGYPGGGGSWTQQGWPQQSGSGGSWHGQNPAWSQQQYQNWSQHQQQMPSSGYPSQQTPFRSPSPASSFQSPPHNPYASPTHQQAFQTPSPSTSQHQYQFPPYQSPPSNQQFQQPYQSPSHHPYQSAGTSQAFHSSQPYHPSNQSYQSPTASQPYQSPAASAGQSYQSPTPSKPYQSSHGSQPYQSPPANHPYQSPPGSQSYQSPTSNMYQSPSGQMYPSPYQSPSHSASQSSPQQPFPPPYQSPSGTSSRYPSQTAWGPQGYSSGYYQGHMGSQGSGAQSSSGKSGGTSVPQTQHQPGASYGQSGVSTPAGPSNIQPQGTSQASLHQQSGNGSEKPPQQIDVACHSKTPNSQNVMSPEALGKQSTPFLSQQVRGGNAAQDSSKVNETKPGSALSMSPAQPVVSKSPVEFNRQIPSESPAQSSTICTSPSVTNTATTLSKSILENVKSPSSAGTDNKSNSGSGKTSDAPITKISTLEFKPNIISGSGLALGKDPTTGKSKELPNTIKAQSSNAEKVETNTSTPMIQQLLMEEPARMNIKKEDREAVMKKPMASPTPPKPKKKYKSKAGQGAKAQGRPRSTSLSSPVPPMVGFGGYPPHPMMNPQMMGRPNRSHSISLPFNSEQRMPVPMQSYGWQQQQQQQSQQQQLHHQWKQQNFPPAGPWQQQQQHQQQQHQQQHWGGPEWQNYSNPGGTGSDCIAGNSMGPMSGRLQHRSVSADAAQSPFYNNAQSNQIPPCSNSQVPGPSGMNSSQNPSAGGSQTCQLGDNANDKSSLSSLFQLVSDVGSDDTGWENTASSVVPNLFPNSNESETAKSTPTSDINQESPSVKDFIILETPFKHGYERANSDTAGMTSSEESDRMETEISGDLRPRTMSRSLSVGSNQARLGKQNRLKKLGFLQNRSMDAGPGTGPVGPNPAYTYTFHVPTPVFKKLKFFKSAEARKHNVKVVRMHPMDARRYSLLKIGREIVKVTRLTDEDLAEHRVTFPPASHFLSADGSTNRVNLDIPTVSGDKRSGDSGGEESSLSKFDTDFPPNKVAPPSSFHASQMSASMARASSSGTRSSPVSADWMRQYPGQQPANFNGGFSPGCQQGGYSPQQGGFSPQQGNFPYPQQSGDRNFGTYPVHQQMPQGNMNRHFGSQPPDNSSGMAYQQFSPKGNSFYPHSASSSSSSSSMHSQGSYYPNQQGTYMNHSLYSTQQQQQQQQYYQQQHQYQQQQQYQLQQQQQQQFPQQQPQTGYNGSHPEPKNGLRSPGQHGLASKIDSGCVYGHSGDEEEEYDTKDTTETSPVNTRVNAQRWDNHAKLMANNAATQHNGEHTGSHQAAIAHSHLVIHSNNSKDEAYSNDQNKFADGEKQLDDHPKLMQKNRKLSLKKSGFSPSESSLKVEIMENSCTENGHTIPPCNVSDNDEDIILATPAYFTRIKSVDEEGAPGAQRSRRKGRMGSRRNVKSLRLKIPLPLPHERLVEAQESFNCHEDGEKSMSSLPRDSDDYSSERRGSTSSRRSTRSTSLDEEARSVSSGRQNRKAKLRSIYSNNAQKRKRKRKRKKRQEPLREGVHYIVVGKFKGHQAMLVKVKKVDVGPSESVRAEMFEENAAREIVRMISPVDEESLPCTVVSDLMDHCSSSADESQTDSEMSRFSIIDDESLDSSKPILSTSKSYQRASRGRTNRKFRSAHASLNKQFSSPLNISLDCSPENEGQPKNVQAGPIPGASENLAQQPCFSDDNFYDRFKESFAKHHKAQESMESTEIIAPEDFFFEGVKKASFCNFQRKFLANVKRLKSCEYSSSSDDEDDILDETILKDKAGLSQMLEVYDVGNNFLPHELRDHGRYMVEKTLQVYQNAYRDTADGRIMNNLKSSRNCKYKEPLSSEFLSAHENDPLAIGEDRYNPVDDRQVSSYNRSVDSDRENTSVEVREDQIFTDAAHGKESTRHHADNKMKSDINMENDGHSHIVEDSLCSATVDRENARISQVLKSSGEEKEDYLKRQMAFFEDISSDSDSNDTIIMDCHVEKVNVAGSASLDFPPALSFGSCRSDTIAACTTIISVPALEIADRSEQVTSSPREIQEKMSDVLSAPKHSGPDELCSSDFSREDVEQAGVRELQNSSNDSEHGEKMHIQSMQVVSESEHPENTLMSEKDIVQISEFNDKSLLGEELASVAPAQYLDTPERDGNKNEGKQKAPQRASDKGKCKGVVYESRNTDNEVPLDSDHDPDASIEVCSSQRQKKPALKKSKRDKSSKLANKRQAVDDGNSSSNDDITAELEDYNHGQTKCLRQRKQTRYTFYPEDIDTSEDDSSDSSDEDFQGQSSQRKGSKVNRKQKIVVPKETPKPARGGQRARPSRGRKKKPPGGEKLLNSLSLLHMATLANLTETQSDALDNQSVSETTTQPDNEVPNAQYADRVNQDHSVDFTPSLEQMSFISPQNSDELEISPPVACSPTDKRSWKQAGRMRGTAECTTASRRLLNFPNRRANLKPGCNGASNLGSKPLPFSRLVTTSASSSPIPSNFAFNHASDSSQQLEPSNVSEDASTPVTLQLLETRRAQVNCASFSMKDILRLATPDDSMDSDSKDSAALVRPPEPKRAQVKSASLSMSDILKLTSVDKGEDPESTDASSSLLSQLAAFDTSNSQPPPTIISNSNSQTPKESAIDSFSSESIPPDSDTSSSHPHPEITAASESLSQVKFFDDSFSQPSAKVKEVFAVTSNSVNADYSLSQVSKSASAKEKSDQEINHCTEANEMKAQVKCTSLSISDLMNLSTADDKTSLDDTSVDKCNKSDCSESGSKADEDSLPKQMCGDGSEKSFVPKQVCGGGIEVLKEVQKSDGTAVAKDAVVHGTSLLTLSSETNNKKKHGKAFPLSPDTVQETQDRKSVNPHTAPIPASEEDEHIHHSPRHESPGKFDAGYTPPVLESDDKSASPPSRTDNPPVILAERSEESKCLSSQVVDSQLQSQSAIPETPTPSAIEIPRISISYDETCISESLKSGQTEPALPKGNHQNGDKRTWSVRHRNRDSDVGLNPLHPLQIPPYPYVSHSYGTQPSQSLQNPSLYYPYCWQWPVHTPGSDPAMSPLNLCTTSRKSPNNYSPITPTSPVSPHYSAQGQGPTVSSLSPPLKRAKPLWYPWLTVDSALTRPESKRSVHNSLEHSKKEHKSANSRSWGLPPVTGQSSDIEHTLPTIVSNKTSKELAPSRTPKDKIETNIVADLQRNSHHRIKDLLSTSPSNSLKISKEAISSCKTISQLLGTVIETAYEQEIGGAANKAGKPAGLNGGMSPQKPSTSVQASNQSNRYKKNSGNHSVAETGYWNGESLTTPSSYLSHKSLVNHAHVKTLSPYDLLYRMNELHGRESTFSGLHKTENDRMKTMLENERKLRGQFGLPSPVNVPPSPKRSDSGCPSLTDRLVTKLIKGDGSEYRHKEPADASRGRKRPSSSQKGNTNKSDENQNTRGHSSQKSGRETINRGGNDLWDRGDGKRKEEPPSSQKSSRDLTVRPVKLPPSRKSVEENLQILGLNTIQPPAAFCSNFQDLPERPVEHGGRVLKVESKRLCELSPFITSQHLVGIRGWRASSVSSSRLLASQSHGRPLSEQLEQEPQLRFLLCAERPLVVAPVCAPPNRATVMKWLQNKMVAVQESKLQQEQPGDRSETELLKTDMKQFEKGERRKSVTFSQHPSMSNIGGSSKDQAELDDSKSLPPPSETSACEGDSSLSVDTDLDISCTPSLTPAPISTALETSTFLSSTAILKRPSQDSDPTTSAAALSIERKRKLRFADPSGSSQSEEASPTDSHTLDEHFRKTKKRKEGMERQKDKLDQPGQSLTNTSSTPARQNSRELFDPACTPISLAGRKEEKTTPEQEKQERIDDTGAPLLRHISTGTENLLRKNVLTSQTQRQFSVLGLTAAEVSQIEGPTPQNTFGFKVPQTHVQDAKTVHKYQYITALSLELHIETRGNLRPDPEFDPIQAIFYSIFDDVPADKGKRSVTGVIIVDLDSWTKVTERNKREMDTSSGTLGGRSTSFQSSPGKPHLGAPSVVRHDAGSSSSVAADTSSSSDTPVVEPGPSRQSTSSQRTYITSSPSKPRASQPPPLTQTSSAKGKGRGKGKRSPGPSSPRPSPASPDGGTAAEALLEKCGLDGVEVTYVRDEEDLLTTFTDLVAQFDPDILVGYEIQFLSWGFLLQRAAHLGKDLCSSIARVRDAKDDNRFSAEKDEWGADHMSEIHVAGRIVLNLWRILRHEAALNVYTFENVAFHILHQRVPLYSFCTLTKWFSHKTHLHRWRVLEHYIVRVKGQLEIIDQLDLIGRTSEFARVFGIEFFDVLNRGSQFRVESMMLRLAKPLNFVAVSPSVNQRARQRAPECIALNLEPESKYYTSPVVVLDFQSLYPSIMIAYNYCFSTCLGRLNFLENAHDGPFEFGCTSLNVTPATLKKISEKITVSPNGVAFVKSSVRKGVLPKMVEEILGTRIMVKKSMKDYKDDKILSRMLDARQLGLKLIANVTYGYTGASFSGRMPCIEVADSIVRKARESLERAIELVRNTPRWGGQVVYGDTDSLFIHFPGRSKDEAFVLGQEIADAVTAMFPSPMKIKFEKVYLPCVLETKKRYVGFMYETPDQTVPVYDAKGIETVRRDSCSAVSKILERSIKVLFSTHDLSRVRAYVTRQLHKLLEGKVSIIDLIFAKEFRGMMGYKPGACVPALEIARKRVRVDRRSEPRVGERVPYVIIHGSPGLPLIQLVREPTELVADTSLRLNATYYITKQILPPLDRLFGLIGVNVFKWYQDMPKVVRVGPLMAAAPVTKQGTISQFFATNNCPVCDVQTKKPVCEKCGTDPQLVVWTLTRKMRDWDRTYSRLAQVCDTCQGTQDSDLVCVSVDCPIMFRRVIAQQDLIRADNLREVLNKYLQF